MTSVIIPIHKNQNTLMRTLKSISGLEDVIRKTIEIVLVFDGDDPECLQIVNDWKSSSDCKIKVVSQEHLGVAAARNFGVAVSTHEMITFLDSDDELLAARFQESTSPFSNIITIGMQELIIQGNLHLQKPELIQLTSPSDFHILTMVLSRKTFDFVGGFDTSYSHGSDWDFVIRARGMDCNISYIDSFFVRRYVHDDNHSLDAPEVKSQHIEAVRRHLKKGGN